MIPTASGTPGNLNPSTTKIRLALLALTAFLPLLAFAVDAQPPAQSPPGNTLTPEEQSAGWKLLFDGQTLKGWRPYGKPGAPIAEGWKIEDGILKKLGGQKAGDIVTVETYDDFELSWEWKLNLGGNNGVKYLVTEARPKAPGHEYQMLDDAADNWKKVSDKDKTASFYNVLAPAADKPLKPAGEWNLSRISIKGDHVEHWLNGRKVLEYELGSEALKAALASSKFRKNPDFGTKIRGHIMLTDHRDEAWLRNIKLRLP